MCVIFSEKTHLFFLISQFIAKNTEKIECSALSPGTSSHCDICPMNDAQCFYSSSHNLDGPFGKTQGNTLLKGRATVSQHLRKYNCYTFVFNLPVNMCCWNRLLGYMNLSHDQCSHSHVSEVIKMSIRSYLV